MVLRKGPCSSNYTIVINAAMCASLNFIADSDRWILGWFKSGKNDKLDIFLLFRPDSESFGKWCLEKCKFFFDTTTLMPAESVPMIYYITHLLWCAY